jgi:hypothetical protein
MPILKKRAAEIAAIADEDIDTSDIPEAGEEFFRNAELRLPEHSAAALASRPGEKSDRARLWRNRIRPSRHRSWRSSVMIRPFVVFIGDMVSYAKARSVGRRRH